LLFDLICFVVVFKENSQDVASLLERLANPEEQPRKS